MVAEKADVVKHLEMAQAIVNRMAGNSFLLKGWSVTAATALIALAAQNKNPGFASVAFLPVLGFWGLDAYYLRRERLYRRLYDEIRRVFEDPNITPTVPPFCMNTKPYLGDVESWSQTLWAGVVVWSHGVMVLVIGLVGIGLKLSTT